MERGRRPAGEKRIECFLETVSAQQRIPHHGRQAQARGHRRARAPAFHVDAELQAAQAALIRARELANKRFDQGQSPGFKGVPVGAGEPCPFIEIKGKSER